MPGAEWTAHKTKSSHMANQLNQVNGNVPRPPPPIHVQGHSVEAAADLVVHFWDGEADDTTRRTQGWSFATRPRVEPVSWSCATRPAPCSLAECEVTKPGWRQATPSQALAKYGLKEL
jgi:hypothetical protein